MNQHRVHVGFGLHVNCYHSYRGDSNDALGFGGDIRIIRKIIAQLNELNAAGIPAKATWDFENGYSLEDILPKYAPDIIEDVRRRVEFFGDENIIMGYNNGALGAMTPDELAASIEWSVTNPQGSGLADLFGTCEKIVRPQEVMFSPPQVRDYLKAGVKALSLYYSCIPFDAFRTIIPQLDDERAFNPLTFTYDGQGITVLPTYSNADLIDAGCLRAFAKDLHAKQCSGEINHDVFLFINMDADAAFWEPLGLPFPINKVANTGGIYGLAKEVADLDYVVFDTAGGYLNNHEPLGEITFGHDTADGNYTGYASWSEKPFNRQIWTRLERARALARAQGQDAESAAFRERVLLLSTTHFGLATPVLNIDRERRALALSAEMLEKELASLPKTKKLKLLNPNGGPLMSAELGFAPGFLPNIAQLEIKAKGLQNFGGLALEYHEDGSVASAFILLNFAKDMPECEIKVNVLSPDAVPPAIETPDILSAGGLELRVCGHGEVLSAKYNGKAIGGKDFLRSFLTYNNRHYPLEAKRRTALPAAGQLQGCRIDGDFTLPGNLHGGACEIDFFTMPGMNCVGAKVRTAYPFTEETFTNSTQSSSLGRMNDILWQQAAPFQLAPKLAGELHVVKRNFSEDVTSYPVSAFRESVPENENLDSFNNQLTGGFVGLTNGETGLIAANARQICGSMAHCPMRLRRKDGQDYVKLNPFGTYYGKQRVHPTRGNGSMIDSYTVVAPQSRSLAPAYNGATELAVMALYGFDGLAPQDALLREICAFADGATLLAPEDSPVNHAQLDYVRFPAATENNTDPAKLKPAIISGVMPSPLKIASIGARAFGNIIRKQWKSRK